MKKHSEIKYYLKFGKQTKPDKKIHDIAKSLKGSTKIKTIKNILDYAHKFPFKPPTKWDRTTQDVIESGYCTQCVENTIVFVTLVRCNKIPAKFVQGVSKRKESGGHAWSEVWYSNEWKLVDPTGGKFDFNPKKTKIVFDRKKIILLIGPFKKVKEGLDSWDIGVGSLKDWKEKIGKRRFS